MRGWVLGIGKLGFGLLVIFVLALTAQAQGTGTLEGLVVNETADGPSIGPGLPVTLYIYRGDIEENTLETTTDAEGGFRFEGLDTDPSLRYWPEAFYLDVIYRSVEPVQFEADRTSLNATIPVFETTDDDSTVRLDSVHIIAESFGEVLRVSEIHLFGNSSDRTYVGTDGATVSVDLPDGAVGLSFGEGIPEERFLEVAGGLVDTEPVPPGAESSLIFFSYHLMSPGGVIPVERRFAYPVSNLSILVAQPGLALNAEQMLAMGTENFQGRQYEFFTMQDLPANTPLVVEFVPGAEESGGESPAGMPPTSGESPASTTTRGNQGLLRWIGFVLAGLAVVGVVAYAATSKQPAPAAATNPNLSSNPKAQRLVAELADLDEAFEAGDLDEAAYEHQRAEKREALKSL
jgi:hypothetical protein